MDDLGVILLMMGLAIIVLSSTLFFKRLKKHERHFKYIFLFLLFCIFSIIANAILCYEFERKILIDFFEIKTTHSYSGRIIKSIIAFTLNIITNYYFAKFYLKRISKIKNEIELIGIK